MVADYHHGQRLGSRACRLHSLRDVSPGQDVDNPHSSIVPITSRHVLQQLNNFVARGSGFLWCARLEHRVDICGPSGPAGGVVVCGRYSAGEKIKQAFDCEIVCKGPGLNVFFQ